MATTKTMVIGYVAFVAVATVGCGSSTPEAAEEEDTQTAEDTLVGDDVGDDIGDVTVDTAVHDTKIVDTAVDTTVIDTASTDTTVPDSMDDVTLDAVDSIAETAGDAATDGAGDAAVVDKTITGLVHVCSQRFGDADRQILEASAMDASGNFVIAGWFRGTLDFGTASLTTAGDSAFVAKFDPTCKLLWSKRFGDSAGASAVAFDASGDVILAGSSAGTVNFGGGALKPYYYSAGCPFLVKLSGASGAHVWSRLMGASSGSHGTIEALAVEPSGTIAAAGYFKGSIDPTVALGAPSSAAIKDHGNQDMFVAVFDATGKPLWNHTAGSKEGAYAGGVAFDPAKNVMVSGGAWGGTDFGGGSPSASGGYIVSYGPTGLHRWTRGFGGTGLTQAIASDSVGNVVFRGSLIDTSDYGAGPVTVSTAGASDIVLGSLTSLGGYGWSHVYSNGPAVQPIHSLALDGSGAVLITAALKGTVDFGTGPLTGTSLNLGAAIFDSKGTAIWARRFTGTATQTSASLALGATSAVIAGRFDSWIDMGGGTLTSAGQEDIYIARYDLVFSPKECVPNPCTDSHKTACTSVDHKAVCGCDAGYAADATGACRWTTPCTPNPCTTDHKTVCTESGFDFSCACDTGYAPDATGTCRWATPCAPNPCTAAKTVCTASGFDYTCSCKATEFEYKDSCYFTCSGGYHLDGDAFEPNECIEQATLVAPTVAGSPVVATTATIGPLSTDVDFFRVARSDKHEYWTLVSAPSTMCAGADGFDLAGSVGDIWNYIGVSSGTTPLAFSCANASMPTYSLGVLDFDLSFGDRPSTGYPSGVGRVIYDTIATGDVDHFQFTTSMPLTISHVGRAVKLDVTAIDPSTGKTLAEIPSNCGFSIVNKTCLSLTGFGSPQFLVSVTPLYDPASPDDTFDAYGVSW